MELLKIKDLKKFIQDNKNILDDNSTLIITHGDKFAFLKDIMFLNITGVYDWTIDGGEILEGKYGDVVMLTPSSECGTFKDGEKSEDVVRDHEAFFQNFSFSSYDSVPKDLKQFENKELKKVFNDDALVSSRVDDYFGMITSLSIYDDITLFYNDSYGHDKVKSPKVPILAFNIGVGLKQVFNPNRTNESNLKRYNDFKL
jgi:hypothetical protein